MNIPVKRVGAGRPANKTKTDACLALSIGALHRHNLLKTNGRFTLYWEMSGTERPSIGIWAEAGKALRLCYSVDQVSQLQTVELDHTPCHFGGSRPWFKCPECTSRVGVLFMNRGRFACRTCQVLGYPSQSEDSIGRAIRQIRKIDARLSGGSLRRSGKPRLMRWRTYARLQARRADLNDAKNEMLLLRCEALLKRLSR